MRPVEGWPFGNTENITIGNPESNVAIATLWSPRANVIEGLDPQSFAVAGQLYSKMGINYALINLLANPNIRQLIIAGVDLSGSGEALNKLWQLGVDTDKKIVGVEKAVICKEIPIEAVEKLKCELEIHDVSFGKGDGVNREELARRVRQIVLDLPKLPPREYTEVFPQPEVELPNIKPSERGAHIVTGSKVGDTWLKALREVMLFGDTDPTNYGEPAKDLTNLVTVIRDEDPDNFEMFDFFEFTKSDLEAYLDEFRLAELRSGEFYGYGERILAYPHVMGPINQLDIVLDKLRRDPNDRGAIEVLYDPYRDNQLDRTEKINGFRNPCIVFIQTSIKAGSLEMTAFFRSNDMFGAWPNNAFGLREYQRKKARELGIPMGPLMTISNRAHIYEHSWNQAKDILQKNSSKLHSGFEMDYRGGFRINVKDGQIQIIQQDGDGNPLSEVLTWDGMREKAWIGAGHQLVNLEGFSSFTHALDIGSELVLATIAAQLGLDYQQDKANVLNQIKIMAEKARKFDELKA